MAEIQSYELTDVAEQDVSEIYDYTFASYGEKQAHKYLRGLHRKLEDLVLCPDMGRQRPDVRKGLRSIAYEKHVIFYRVLQGAIRVVRILHSRRDLPEFFKE